MDNSTASLVVLEKICSDCLLFTGADYFYSTIVLADFVMFLLGGAYIENKTEV